MIGVRARTELLWVASGQVTSLLLSILTLKVLTFRLGPEGYGQFALGLSIAGGLNLFLYGPLSQAVSRYVHVCSGPGDMNTLNQVVSAWLRNAFRGVLLAGFVLVAILWGGSLAQWIALVFVALGYGVFSGMLSVYLADINTRRQRRTYSILQSSDAALRLMVAMILVVWWAESAVLAMSGFMVGSLLVGAVAYRMAGKGVPADTLPPASSAHLFSADFTRYAISFSLLAVPGIFATYGDRWLIQQTMTDADVGIYVALAQIAAAPANLLLSIFSQVLNPVLFQRAGAANSPGSVRASRILLYRALVLFVIVLATLVVASAAFGVTLVQWMTSAAFAHHGGLLWNLVLSAAIFQVGQALAAESFIYNRPFLMFFPKMAHAAIFLGLASVFVAGRGLGGVAWAAVVAAFSYLALVLATNSWAGKRYVANHGQNG